MFLSDISAGSGLMFAFIICSKFLQLREINPGYSKQSCINHNKAPSEKAHVKFYFFIISPEIRRRGVVLNFVKLLRWW